MTPAEIITDIKNHGFNDQTDATLYGLINDAVWDIDSREIWPYLDTSTVLTWAANSATATGFPAQFSKVLSLINTSTGVVLQPEAFDVIRKNFPTALTETGEPTRYYFIGDTLYVYPVPATDTSLTLAYVQWQTEITAVTTEAQILLPSRHHRIIVLKVLSDLYAQEDDLETASFFTNKFNERLVMMTYDIFMKQFDRPGRVYSVDYEDFWGNEYW